MPTLIRLLVFLLVLAGLAFGGMVALTIMVDPGQKEMRVKIPARELGVEANTSDPLGLRPKAVEPEPEPVPAPPAAPAADATPATEGETTTVDIPE